MNQKKNYLTTPKESGFTLVEVIVAVAILSFAIFATLRVITASLNSITRQGQRVKALHLAQAHLAKLEAESFPRVVPENCKIPQWREGEDEKYEYTLSIYDEDIPYDTILIVQDDDYWYDTEGLGFDGTGLRKDDGLLVADRGGTPYRWTSASPPLPGEFYWDSGKMQLHFRRDPDEEKEVQIYYRYYHLIDEGATIPSSDGEALKMKTIKLITSVGNTDGSGQAGELSDILGYDLTDGALLSDIRENFDPQTGELTFKDGSKGHSVWIYYLPDSDTDISGPDGAPDGYLDPTENSIIGVAAGNSCYPDGSPSREITNIKKIIVTEYWKQGKDIQSTKQETYITR